MSFLKTARIATLDYSWKLADAAHASVLTFFLIRTLRIQLVASIYQVYSHFTGSLFLRCIYWVLTLILSGLFVFSMKIADWALGRLFALDERLTIPPLNHETFSTLFRTIAWTIRFLYSIPLDVYLDLGGLIIGIIVFSAYRRSLRPAVNIRPKCSCKCSS